MENIASTSSSSSNIHQEDEEESPHLPFLMGNHFDIEAYANHYHGRSKILHLLSIADRCSDSDDRQLEALRIAYDTAKKGKDVNLFTEIVKKIRGRLGPNYTMDENWRNEITQNWDEMECRVVKFAMNCEENYRKGIIGSSDIPRRAFEDAANMYYNHGETREATIWYTLRIHLCQENKYVWETFMGLGVVLIQRGRFHNAELNAKDGLEFIEQLEMDSITFYSLHSTIGLACLKDRRFTDAAHQFLQISEELGNKFSEVMAAHDIAAYGGLCALATFERTELKTLVLDNKNFQCYLDSTIEVKELINDFYSRRYSSAFKHLDNLREWLSRDIYLFDQFETLHEIIRNDQFETLHEIIRNKALVQYIQPFNAVDLQTMADVFNTNIDALKKELVPLINHNQIKAKIDSVDNVLYARKDQRRNATFRSVLQNCSEIERDIRSILLFKSVHHYTYVRKGILLEW